MHKSICLLLHEKKKQNKTIGIKNKQKNQKHIIQDEQPDDANQETARDDDNQDNSQPPNQNETNGESNVKENTDPVMEIEGIVHGEADNNVVQSASRFSAMDDEDNKV